MSMLKKDFSYSCVIDSQPVDTGNTQSTDRHFAWHTLHISHKKIGMEMSVLNALKMNHGFPIVTCCHFCDLASLHSFVVLKKLYNDNKMCCRLVL